MAIPVIDIFAGPGGLGEGFSNVLDAAGERIFKIKLSIEKDKYAHQTLKLRSFFRQFPPDNVPEEYYLFVSGKITIDDLYDRYPEEAICADNEACCATLGEPDEEDTNALDNEEVDFKIQEALGGERNWLLIGGPPCQAYSLAGRSRRKEKKLDEAKDKRVGLYKEYLRIIAVHRPAVFVMENVKGLLSAQTEEEFLFLKILRDLKDPVTAYISEGEDFPEGRPLTRYRIFSLTTRPREYDEHENPVFKPHDFIIKSEEYGIPQRRHRVILLGIREDIERTFDVLERQDEVSLLSVIGNLPPLRSGITRLYTHTTVEINEKGQEQKRRHYIRIKDSFEKWEAYLKDFNLQIDNILSRISPNEFMSPLLTLGLDFLPTEDYNLWKEHPLGRWYKDVQLKGILQHVSRKHLVQDLKRYLFATRFTKQKGYFPRLEDYKRAGMDLLPDHENADSGKFADRFRVQMPNAPATTITSHISKDGHYFIHYDPNQCRSFSVREAARVQTFPDNYYFCGGRTEQFHQVGNAVPPYLAYQIAKAVAEIFVGEEILEMIINEREERLE